jgi:Tfp pilus assembly protein PilO
LPLPVKIDFSNINDVLNELLKNRKIIINIGLFILTFIVSWQINTKFNKINTALKEQIILERRKNELVDRLINSEKKLLYYKDILKKKETPKIINSLTRLAQESGVKIVSIRPERAKEYAIYAKVPLRLSLHAENFHNIGKFISKLESLSDLYKIELRQQKGRGNY